MNTQSKKETPPAQTISMLERELERAQNRARERLLSAGDLRDMLDTVKLAAEVIRQIVTETSQPVRFEAVHSGGRVTSSSYRYRWATTVATTTVEGHIDDDGAVSVTVRPIKIARYQTQKNGWYVCWLDAGSLKAVTASSVPKDARAFAKRLGVAKGYWSPAEAQEHFDAVRCAQDASSELGRSSIEDSHVEGIQR